MSNPNPISAYKSEVEKEIQQGQATEHTYRPALIELIKALDSGITATNEPKHRTDCGAPDIAVSKETPHGLLSIGNIETKDIGVSLDEAGRSDQLKRYLKHLPNLILTDYLEFRWYVDGDLRDTKRLARFKDEKLKYEKDGAEAVLNLLKNFIEHPPEPISSPQSLAQRMAHKTHMIRDIVIEAFGNEKATDTLRDLRGAFAKTIIPDIDQPDKTPEFADMYAQTLAYGLFAARCNHKGPGPFERRGAAQEIPKTNPFLRKLFEMLTGTALEDEPYAGFVEDLVSLLAHAEMDVVLENFGKRKGFEDPVVHFYETFLKTYDPKLRESRGVYYTPEPVVSYIVRSVDHILRERFGCVNGLADNGKIKYECIGENGKKEIAESHRVLLLDPACGTGTFLYAVVNLIREQFKNNVGMWKGYVQKHLLPRVFGFELLMAPYAVAHFKLGMQLAAQDMEEPLRKKWAYDFSSDERLGIYLTNTLEEAEVKAKQLGLFERFIAEEANGAAKIKNELPILVIMGNPPYSGHSANRSWEIIDGKRTHTFIGELLNDYYFVDGKPLGERNPKWLQDDYVKFIRWGQWRIEQTGHGVLAFITNHAYLDNPTFRGMRQQLMKAFDEIYILDLHGNAKKKEKCPDGSKDENVFDIQQGVAIGIYIKYPKSNQKGLASVHHADLWGLRKIKYRNLEDTYIKKTKWTEINPRAPSYVFIRQKTKFRSEYECGYKITEVMPINSVGIVTGKDEEAIAETYERAMQMVKSNGLPRDIERSILYRPFDQRFILYDGTTVTRPRYEIMRHMFKRGNLGLISVRQVAEGVFNHVFVTKSIVESRITLSNKGIAFLFPLYLYPDPDENGDLFSNGAEKHVNLSPTFIRDIEININLKFVCEGKGNFKKNFGPEDVFNYIYGVFHSPTYRERYKEFLKMDFPRVPLTSDKELFRALCEKGGELVSLHLLESPGLSHLITTYPETGDDLVEKSYPKYFAPGDPEPGTGDKLPEGRVYINKTQHFKGVPPEVWEFHIGGYQVCHKWLKDRVGRKLSSPDDLNHYQKIIVAISETIRLMKEIDEDIESHGSWPLDGA